MHATPRGGARPPADPVRRPPDTRRAPLGRGLAAGAAVALAALLGGCVATTGGGLTREQGDAILAELRDIRRALEARPAPAAAPATPRDPVARVRADAGPALGDAAAPLVLIEYTDFQCSFCRRHHDRTYGALKRNYVDTGRVRYVVRDLPLSFHDHARPAAIAARCAAAQGRYWEARDALFTTQQELSPATIRTTVLGTGVDAARFDACVADPATAAAVQADADEAAAAGITGTPSFVLGRLDGDAVEGVVIGGAQPYATFATRIDALLGDAPAR